MIKCLKWRREICWFRETREEPALRRQLLIYYLPCQISSFFLHGNVLLSNRNVKIARVVAFLLSSESHAGAIELSWISNAMVNDKAQIMESSCKR